MQAASKANNAFDCPVVSSANMIAVSNALDAPANIADIPTKAASGIVISDEGKKLMITLPSSAPVAPPIVNNGAKVPPEVPLPSATASLA